MLPELPRVPPGAPPTAHGARPELPTARGARPARRQLLTELGQNLLQLGVCGISSPSVWCGRRRCDTDSNWSRSCRRWNHSWKILSFCSSCGQRRWCYAYGCRRLHSYDCRRPDSGAENLHRCTNPQQRRLTTSAAAERHGYLLVSFWNQNIFCIDQLVRSKLLNS